MADSTHTESCHEPCQQPLFAGKLARIFTACGVSKDSDLARILEIKPQSVAAARKREQIPSGWVEFIADKFQISS